MFTNNDFVQRGYSVFNNAGKKALGMIDPKTGRIAHIIDHGSKGAAVRFLSDTYTKTSYNGERGETLQVKGKTFLVSSNLYTEYEYSYGSERPYGAVDLVGEDGTKLYRVPVTKLELVL